MQFPCFIPFSHIHICDTLSITRSFDQLRFKRPNHQLCITNQQVLEKYLHFFESIKLL